MEIKEGQETALVSAWTLCYLPVCIRGTDKRIQSELDPPGSATLMPSAHTQNSHSATRATPHLSAQEPQASPDQRLLPRPRPSSHLYPDAKSVPAACQPTAKRGKPEDALRLGEQNSHWPWGLCWPQENADGGGRNTAVTHMPAPSQHQAHSAAWT